jgi:hypothetical protein
VATVAPLFHALAIYSPIHTMHYYLYTEPLQVSLESTSPHLDSSRPTPFPFCNRMPVKATIDDNCLFLSDIRVYEVATLLVSTRLSWP